ncbi:hypothetical protein GGI42DRAFT_332301 [Trichoderma sp. SZMC 28013]
MSLMLSAGQAIIDHTEMSPVHGETRRRAGISRIEQVRHALGRIEQEKTKKKKKRAAMSVQSTVGDA